MFRPFSSQIRPGNLFSRRQTEGAAAGILGRGAQRAFVAPQGSHQQGISFFSPGQQYQRAMQSAGDWMGAVGESEQQRLSDAQDNANFMLQGQRSRLADVLGQSTAAADYADARQGLAGRAGQGLLDAIANRMGGISGRAQSDLEDQVGNANRQLQAQRSRLGDVLGQSTSRLDWLDTLNDNSRRAGGGLLDAISSRMGGIAGRGESTLGDRNWLANYQLRQQRQNLGNLGSAWNMAMSDWR